MSERFDYLGLVDELSCRDTQWLLDHRDSLVREQRRLHVRELAVLAVLDRRGAVGDVTAAEDGVSIRSMRNTIDTARRLEDLPTVAAAAYAGELSDEQLTPTVQLADPSSDREWAHRAHHTAPNDLRRAARTITKPTPEDARARREARSLRLGWDDEDRKHMLHVWGELPDVMGATFEQLINDLVDQMKPAPGQPWTRRDQRAADALLVLCDAHDQPKADTDEPTLVARKPRFVVEVPQHGPATIAGVPLPDTMVEQLRAEAIIEPVLVNDDGVPLAWGRAFAALSSKIIRAVTLRDGHCRCGNCDRRHGLQIHHLWPRSWGGTDDIANLSAVCVGGGTDHHPMLVPHGPWLLLGNPNQPDGLRLVHRDQIPDLDRSIRERRPPTLDELDLDQPQPDRPDVDLGSGHLGNPHTEQPATQQPGKHDSRAGPEAA